MVFLLLTVTFLVVPIAELAVIVTVARSLGVLDTIGLLIVVSLVGAWLTRREGLGVLARIRSALQRGELPSRDVANGFLILLAGALMVTPGFLTDGLGLLLLIPPTRALVRGTLLRGMARRGHVTVISGRPAGAGGARRDGEDAVWDVESWEEPPTDHRGELT